MWKLVDGKLIHTTDTSRVKFRTNISRAILKSLKEVATENSTHINYLLETGLKETLSLGAISFDKKSRPKDRIQYKTTYDRELLESVRSFAIRNNLFINDVIEYSVQFIDVESSKDSGYKHRVE
ncbi:rRNA methyltransferase [Sporosarcina sp. G11-34]|uniref:rRNA methyltransferase n=1 Tax=Sporosarcina sp. G11-34 TaxID=2849605 RepID=UPI0022A91321|nr:rRNA methyltransferase [Sporosarcina sp. G11-34]MCZ2258154.1 rRNA methyltransferase [Sporosarcina sp. G11-34]